LKAPEERSSLSPNNCLHSLLVTDTIDVGDDEKGVSWQVALMQ